MGELAAKQGILPFFDESAAYRFVEECRWPEGPVCPHCGGSRRVRRMNGSSTRPGTYKCYECRKPFTVKIGTILEGSHVRLHLWLQALFLTVHAEAGPYQLHRTLGVTMKTASHLSRRIRSASNDARPN